MRIIPLTLVELSQPPPPLTRKVSIKLKNLQTKNIQFDTTVLKNYQN